MGRWKYPKRGKNGYHYGRKKKEQELDNFLEWDRQMRQRREKEGPDQVTFRICYIDGSCLKNPGGPTGSAAAIASSVEGEYDKLVTGKPSGTNNTAELEAVENGLQLLSQHTPTVKHDELSPYIVRDWYLVTDSSYVVGQLQSGWKTNENVQLIHHLKQKLLEYQAQFHLHSIVFQKVPAHRGIPGNEYVDDLAGKQSASYIGHRTTSTQVVTRTKTSNVNEKSESDKSESDDGDDDDERDNDDDHHESKSLILHPSVHKKRKISVSIRPERSITTRLSTTSSTILSTPTTITTTTTAVASTTNTNTTTKPMPTIYYFQLLHQQKKIPLLLEFSPIRQNADDPEKQAICEMKELFDKIFVSISNQNFSSSASSHRLFQLLNLLWEITDPLEMTQWSCQYLSSSEMSCMVISSYSILKSSLWLGSSFRSAISATILKK